MARAGVVVREPLEFRRGIQDGGVSPVAPRGEDGRVGRVLALCAQQSLDRADQDELFVLGASLDASEWQRVCARACEGGLAGLVVARASEVPLFGLMPPGVARDLLDAYRVAWIGNRRLRGALAEVLAAFAARGVEAMPFKGVALALRYYGEPALRPAGDLDLLVRRADVRACRAVLKSLGWQAHAGMGNRRAFYPLLYRTMVFEHPTGLTIELHWELTALPMYLPRLRADAALWARAERIDILGQPARYLAPADELRYLALHATVQHADTPRAIWLVDIAYLVGSLPPTWDWDAFARETIHLGLGGPVMAALLAAREYGMAPVPRPVLDALAVAAATRREQRAWRRSLGSAAGVRRPGAVMRHLRAQDSLVDQGLLFFYLVGRARRRWLRHLRVGARRSSRQIQRDARASTGSPRREWEMSEVIPSASSESWRPPDLLHQETPPPTALAPVTVAAPAPMAHAVSGDHLVVVFEAPAIIPNVLPQPGGPAMRVVIPDPEAPVSKSLARRRRAYRVAKRALDVVVALVLLALLSPLFALVACLVKLDGGPIIYPRAAIGRGERSFSMLKFRTMRPDADAVLQADPELYAQYQQNFKLARDPRVTTVGRWLRRTSIDELPQLWNIVCGEMSLVGPRAVAEDEVPAFGPFFRERQSVLPGLTGLWQISGRARNTYQRRIALDREYVRTCSFWGDIGILLRTVPAVLRGSGAY